MGLWIMSQDGENLLLAEKFEIYLVRDKATIYANDYVVGIYSSKTRAREILMEIADQLRKGSCFDDMYQHRRVSKQNVYHMPKE